MFHDKILHQNLRHSSVWNPQLSFQVPHCQSPTFADGSLHTLSILRGSACCRPSRTWVTLNRFLIVFEIFVPHFYLCCTHYIIPESLQNHPNSFLRGMFQLNTKFDADSLLWRFTQSFWIRATQYTCSLTGIYHPPGLVQWSRSCSHMHIPAHSPWLPGYIDVIKTVLVIITMVGLFPDKLYIHIYLN